MHSSQCPPPTWRSTTRPLASSTCSALHAATPWGRPRACLHRTAPAARQQRHVAHVSGRTFSQAAPRSSATAAWAAPRQPCAELLWTSPTTTARRAVLVSSSSRKAKGEAGSRSYDPGPQQPQQQQPANRTRRQQHINGTAATAFSPSKVSPARLTALIKEQTSLADLQGLLSQHDSMLNVFHVTAALQWLVAHPQEQPESSEQLAALVQQWLTPVTVDQLTARDCANLAYYCSKLGYVEGAPDPVRVYKDLLQRFMVVKGDAVPQAVSNLLYALGSQEQLRGVLKQDTLVTLLQQLNQVAGRATPQNLSNALWAAAKVKPQDSQQLEDVVAQLLNKFINNTGNAKPQEVSNVLYALALLPRTWPMDSAPELVERLVQLLPEAQPQHMSNVLWALGQYAEQGWLLNLPKQSMARVMAAATEILTQLSPGATQGRPGGSRPVVNGQDLSNACWGVAKLQQLGDAPPGQQHQPWQEPFSSAVQALVRLLSSAEPQHVANVLWSCAVVRHYPQQLLHDVVAALPKVQQANTQEVANMAWALAVLAPDPPPAALTVSLLQRMQALLAQQPAAVNSQDLANTAWAVAVLDQQQLAGQLAPLAAAAFSQQQWPTSQAEALRQWQQVHLWLMDTQVLGPAGLGAVPGVTQQQLEQCQAAWEEQLTREAKASEVQKEVAKVLSSMPGVTVVGLEQRDQHDGSRSIDIVADFKGQLLAVEVDGPTHFTWPGQRPTGLTLARNRALQRRSYRVVGVPVDPGWAQRRGLQQQQRYLQGLLDGQPTSNKLASNTITATSPARTSSSSNSSSSSSSSSSSLAPPTPASSPTTGLAVPGTPGLLARPQRPQPTAAPRRPAKTKRQRS